MNDQDVRQMITDMLAAEGHEGDPGADGGLNLSSLELVRLLVSLEERLGISLDDAAILNTEFNSIEDIVELLTQSV